VRIHGVELEICAPQQFVQRPLQVVVPEPRRFIPVRSEVIRRRALPRAAAACGAGAPGVEMVGVRRQSKSPSNQLTLSAPNTRMSARTPAARSTAPSSISAHASRSAPASSSARAPWPRRDRTHSPYNRDDAGGPGRSRRVFDNLTVV
jgi:hypothetical protein